MVQKVRSILIPFGILCGILFVSSIIIAFGRGYRINIKKTQLVSTGLVSATSDPIGTQILINTKLKAATNTSFSLDPGWYTVRLVKEGFQSWEKYVRVQGEVVTRIDAFLFPTNPSLSAITTSGTLSPTLSPDGTKIAFIAPKLLKSDANGQEDRAGIWILDVVNKPLGFNRDARHIAQTGNVDLAKATLMWSPDTKQILVCTAINSCYLLDADRTVVALPGAIQPKTILASWEQAKRVRAEVQLESLDPDFIRIASTSALLLSFSPDESKILYEATASATIPEIIKPPLIGTNPTQDSRELTPGTLYVYDIKEDRNYALGEAKLLFPQITKKEFSAQSAHVNLLSSRLQWFPTSKHLIVTTEDKIEIMEYDSTNRVTVYAGPFAEGFVAPWTNPTKLVILTNLNATASTNNLYSVNLR